MPEYCTVVINAGQSEYIAHDVLDLIREFRDIGGPGRGIKVELVGFKEKYKLENTLEENQHIWTENSAALDLTSNK